MFEEAASSQSKFLSHAHHSVSVFLSHGCSFTLTPFHTFFVLLSLCWQPDGDTAENTVWLKSLKVCGTDTHIDAHTNAHASREVYGLPYQSINQPPLCLFKYVSHSLRSLWLSPSVGPFSTRCISFSPSSCPFLCHLGTHTHTHPHTHAHTHYVHWPSEGGRQR